MDLFLILLALAHKSAHDCREVNDSKIRYLYLDIDFHQGFVGFIDVYKSLLYCYSRDMVAM